MVLSVGRGPFIHLSQVCILGNPGQEEDATALVARLAQGTRGDRKNEQPVDAVDAGGGETDDSTSTDNSSTSSNELARECKRNTSESAVQKPRKKRKPKKIPHKFMDISWLSDMLSEFQQDVGKPDNPDNQPPKTETAIGMSSSSSSSSSSNIAAVVEDVLKGGFEKSTKSSVFQSEADEVEKGEEQDIQDMSNESGLSLMVQRETKLVEDAIGKTAKLKSKDKEVKGQQETVSDGSIAAFAKSPVVEENLKNSILEFVSQGLDPEDAATEAMLNSSDLLGNEGVGNVVSSAVSATDSNNPDNDPGPGPAVSGAGESQRDNALNNDRFSKWHAECALSIKALQTRLTGMAQPLGSELSLAEHEGNVMYIHWKDSEKFLGRPASLDKQFGVKCIVPVGALKDPRDYSSAHIIWPSIGIQMLRQKGHKAFLRPRVPDLVLRVASIWKQALVCKDSRHGLDPLAEYSALIPSDRVCIGCGQGGAIIAQNESVQTCPLCLQSFHWVCARELAKYGEKSRFSFPDDMELCTLPQPEVFESQTMRPPILGHRLIHELMGLVASGE